MPDVFISHSQHDHSFIDNVLLPALHAHGISAWYSKKDIRTAEEWQRMIVHGLEESQWFLVVLTEKATKSEWIQAEVQWAMKHRRGKIIPLLLQDCNVSHIHLLLDPIQFADFRLDKQAGLQTLLQIWNKTHVPIKPPRPAIPARFNLRSRLTIVTTAVALLFVTTFVVYYSNAHEKNSASGLVPPDQKARPDTGLNARFYYNMGLKCYNRSDFKMAADYFSTGLVFNPDDTNALIYRAAAWKQLNSYANARADLLKVIPLVRYQPLLYYQLGIVEYDLSDFPKSVQAFTKAIDLGYPDHEIYVDRGDALRRAGQTPDACKDYKAAADFGKNEGIDRYKEYCPLTK